MLKNFIEGLLRITAKNGCNSYSEYPELHETLIIKRKGRGRVYVYKGLFQ